MSGGDAMSWFVWRNDNDLSEFKTRKTLFLFAEKALPAGFPQIIQNPAMKVFSSWINIVIQFNIINIANIGIVIFTSRIAILSSPGGRKGSTCCVGVRSFGKSKADNHVDQGHDAHRPEGQPEAQPDEAR